MTLLDAPPVQSEPGPPLLPPKPLWWERVSPEAALTFVIVAACAIFTFVELEPSNIFANTTPSGGDLGAHVWLPWFVEHDLLPHFRITGWTMDWYAGFPVLTYYFPLPMLAIIALNAVLPYNIAFKVVVVSGLIALPVVVWAFGRLARMLFPAPACMAAATLPYLFSRNFTIYGGNIASSMAGEFSFSLSLAIVVLLFGVTVRGLRTGRHRFMASILLLCAGLSHVLPTMFGVLGIVVLTAMAHISRRERRVWLWTLPVFLVGGLLSCFWSLAFELRLPYATNMGYQKIVTYASTLFPAGLTWLFILAGIGAILSIARRRQVGTFLAIMSALSVLIFWLAPQGRLWNARVLPFWFLCLYLLAGLAFCEVGILAAERLRGEGFASRSGLVAIPVFTLLVSLVWTGYPLRILPGGTTTASGDYDWLGITSSDNSFVPGWVTWDLTGYQGTDKSSRTEYFALLSLMTKIGKNYGCGRAMWEYQPELNDMGTPDALMLLPYWTNNCIDSMEGLYYESSATTPYHFTNVSELSEQPSDPMRGIPYASSPSATPPGQDITYFAEGIEHLQMFGVKYYMSVSPQTQQLANANPDLRLIGSTGNYTVDMTSTDGSGPSGPQAQHWDIYEVLDSTLVTPLQNQPVVMNGTASGNLAWQNAAIDWYDDPSRWSVYEAATGPKSWDRVSASDQNPPQTPLPPVTVSDIKVNQESMSFNVDRTGVPVLVNTSYFPNWEVSGGKGPYRVTPNLMVVIPTSRHVTMTYGYTTLDKVGYGMSFLGLIGLVVLWRSNTLEYASTRFRGAHALSGPPPPDPTPTDSLTDPWARLGVELAEGDGPPPAVDMSSWLDYPDLAPGGPGAPGGGLGVADVESTAEAGSDETAAMLPPLESRGAPVEPVSPEASQAAPELPPLGPTAQDLAFAPLPVYERPTYVAPGAEGDRPEADHGALGSSEAELREAGVGEADARDADSGEVGAPGAEPDVAQAESSAPSGDGSVVEGSVEEPMAGHGSVEPPAAEVPEAVAAEAVAPEAGDEPEAEAPGTVAPATGADPTPPAGEPASQDEGPRWGIPGVLPDRTFPSGFLGGRRRPRRP